MGSSRSASAVLLLPLLLVTALPAPAFARDASAEPTVIRDPEIGAPVTPFVFEGDVRDLPPPPVWKPGDPIKEIPRRFYPPPGEADRYEVPEVAGRDALLDRQRTDTYAVDDAFAQPTRNFPGQGFSGVNPPDTAGDVGPDHYIQMINAGGGALVRIYDKAEPTPAVLATFVLDSLGSGSCASGFGDPIVLYDRLADRWMLSEFSSSGNRLCLYISQTGDPVSGGWFNYGYIAPSSPDYPKYGVWPTDANGGAGSYVVTANDGGPGVYALDRGAMLAGQPGTYQRLTIPGLPGFGFEAPTPADLDGADVPPATAPAIIMRHRDTEVHNGPSAPADLLEHWAFDVDWINPSNTTLTQLPSIDVAEFDSSLCGLTSFFCFPQPGTGTTLDPLREVIMNRLVYRVFDDYEAVVGNFVVDIDGLNTGGVRWFELRRENGGPWTLFQEGTYAIDDDNRFMGAIAIDQSGNIALAYNVSSSTVFPSLRYTGRLATDPPGTMSQPEIVMHAGTASNSSNRYGDYAAMNVDPTDDCTFWFTGEDNTSSSWRTQIASFRFDACGCELAPSSPVASAVVAGDNRIDVSWDDSSLETVVEYRVRRSFASGGPYETIAVVTDSSPGVAGGPGYVYEDTDVSGGTSYFYTIVSTDGAACTSDPSNETGATATGACTLAPLFDGLLQVSTPFDPTCTLDLGWNAATPQCGGPAAYAIYRSETEGFVPSAANLLVPQVAETTYSDVDTLASDVPYYYVVRATDLAVGIEEDNAVEVSGIPQGALTNGTWTDDAGDTGVAKMQLNDPWHVNASQGNLGPSVYRTGTYNSNLCTGLVTPPLQLGTGSVLTFSSRYDIESSWDKGEVQVSTNGGTSWQRVPVNYPGGSSNTADNCGLPTGTYFTGTDNDFQTYTGSLASWAGQSVLLRFVLSTDSSVVGNGWWIDDISITDVDVPGECTPGSACAENPSVNVVPEGPMAACEGIPLQLDAQLDGGEGPFLYQWTRDGLPIPDETGATLSVMDTGTHTYNVSVRAQVCENDSTDAFSTEVAWTGAPLFDGLASATNAQSEVCTVDLAWDPATGPCPGPVTYSVFRDVTSPVTITEANRIADGLTGTTWSDSDSLASGATYVYAVRANEGSTGQQDGNTEEQAAIPTGEGGGLQVLFADDFTNPFNFPSTWDVSTGPGAHTCGAWAPSNQATQRPETGDGFYLLADSASCGPGTETSTYVDSVAIDADIPGIVSVTLDYEVYFRSIASDDATVEVWDGSAWQVVWADTDDVLDLHQSWDVTAWAAGNADFRIRFSYQDAAYSGWFGIDNVVVTADVASFCATAGGGAPPPAPDGSDVTEPVRGRRLTPAGDTIEVTWDALTCPAADYNLIYGDLANVASYAVAGSRCSLGTGGTYAWDDVPSGSLYFLVVGTDTEGVESSWGVDSARAERNGPAGSGECGAGNKNPSVSCP